MDVEGGFQALGDQLLYGRGRRSHQAGSGAFGDALYQLKEKKRRCCWYRSHATTFYEDIIVVSDEIQFLCFPPRKREFVMVPDTRHCLYRQLEEGPPRTTKIW